MNDPPTVDDVARMLVDENPHISFQRAQLIARELIDKTRDVVESRLAARPFIVHER